MVLRTVLHLSNAGPRSSTPGRGWPVSCSPSLHWGLRGAGWSRPYVQGSPLHALSTLLPPPGAHGRHTHATYTGMDLKVPSMLLTDPFSNTGHPQAPGQPGQSDLVRQAQLAKGVK